MPRRIVYRDCPVYSRKRFYPWPQPNVPPWWVKKRKPTPVAKPVYRHKRTKSAWLVANVGAWWARRRKPRVVPQPIYRHKRGKSAAFIPGVAPPVVIYTPFKRRRHAPSAPFYKHKCRRSAHFIPGVAPPLITTVQDVLLIGVNTGRLMTHN